MRNRRILALLSLVLAIGIAGCSALKGPAVKPPEEGDVDIPIANASFEESDPDNPQRAADWVNFAGVVWGQNVLLDDTRVFSGQKALAVHTADPPTNTGIRSAPVPAIPGRLYRASVMAYLDATGGQASIYLEFYDASMKRIWVATTVRNEWHTIEITDRAPEEAEYITINIYRTSTATGTHYFDDVKLTLLAE